MYVCIKRLGSSSLLEESVDVYVCRLEKESVGRER
jgi:hypothetical protein